MTSKHDTLEQRSKRIKSLTRQHHPELILAQELGRLIGLHVVHTLHHRDQAACDERVPKPASISASANIPLDDRADDPVK